MLDMADDDVDVGEQISVSLINERVKNWQMFLTILQNIQFLEDQGNFDQLMKLNSKIDPRITSWIEKNATSIYIVIHKIKSLNPDSHLPKKFYICFNESPLKMMKNTF